MEKSKRFEVLRRSMVKEQIEARGVRDKLVLSAFKVLPRHLFVPEDLQDSAYDDAPLPIGGGQTISQPYIVALMSEALDVSSGDKVLEVGTGSGYQAGILAAMGCKVYSIEKDPVLSKKAEKALASCGLGEEVKFFVGDGTLGLPEFAPYDAIIVTAGAPSVPPALKEQLRPEEGVLVIPVGTMGSQELLKIVREGDLYRQISLGGVRFVPLTGERGW
ncbi:protein-L-isoaspartate(D-aspartate) O-methyltransferase [bacterium]|nr:MAG: protein-L-isoaspartate(D-aspartate) O-methyltransferase [bacterium]